MAVRTVETQEDEDETSLKVLINGKPIADLEDNGMGMQGEIYEVPGGELQAAELIIIARWLLKKAEERARREALK